MDLASVALLIVAVAPWIRSAIKSIELAGIGKIELNDVEAVAKEVGASDLPSPSEPATVPESAEAEQAGVDTAPEPENGAPEKVVPPVFKPHVLMYKANPSKNSFKLWLKDVNDDGGWGAVNREESLNSLEFESSLLSSKSRRVNQVEMARQAMLIYLRHLCQIYGIAPLGLSAGGMLKRLQSRSAVTANQARGIAAAISMVNSVLHTPTTPQAMQRTLDVANEVIESLNELVRQAEIARLAPNKDASSNSDGSDQAS